MGIWTQPIGKTLAERKGATPVQPYMLNQGGDGYVNLAWDGALTWRWSDHKQHKEATHVREVTGCEVVTEDAYRERSSVGRMTGGAVLGAVVLGPLGAVLGAGMGAAARKSNLPHEYLVIHLQDGRALTVGVAAKHAGQARAMRDAILAGMETVRG